MPWEWLNYTFVRSQFEILSILDYILRKGIIIWKDYYVCHTWVKEIPIWIHVISFLLFHCFMHGTLRVFRLIIEKDIFMTYLYFVCVGSRPGQTRKEGSDNFKDGKFIGGGLIHIRGGCMYRAWPTQAKAVCLLVALVIMHRNVFCQSGYCYPTHLSNINLSFLVPVKLAVQRRT